MFGINMYNKLAVNFRFCIITKSKNKPLQSRWSPDLYYSVPALCGHAIRDRYLSAIETSVFSCTSIIDFLVHLNRRLKCTIVIMRCPSSVRPSVVNFSHFRLLLWNGRTEFNESWYKGRSQCPLLSLYFSGRSQQQDDRPGLWLAETFSTSLLKPLNGIQQMISMFNTKFLFFRADQ